MGSIQLATAGPPQRFGRYRVVGTLGAGGMGAVYLAVDDVLGREVAVKTLLPTTSALGARILDERFRNEARAVAALVHPHVVQIYDVDVDASPPYLVMERVGGASLKDRLADGPLGLDEARALLGQMAGALAAAHARGIVHRDLKPANILSAGALSWKLADFGVAHVPDSSLTMTGQFVGSPAYAAPEAILQGALTAPCDVYGLGAVLYEALAGDWPRARPSAAGIASLVQPVDPLVPRDPTVPVALIRLIEACLVVNASARPTAAEVAAALAQIDRASVSAPVAPALARRVDEPAIATAATRPLGIGSTSPPSRARWLVPLIGLALLAIVIAVAVASSSAGRDVSPLPLWTTPNGTAGSASSAAMPMVPTTRPTDTLPPGLQGKADKELRKVQEELARGKPLEARRKLMDLERKYGVSATTQALARLLDQLGATAEAAARDDDRHDKDH